MFDLLNKHLESIVDDKEKILDRWIGCGIVQERLKLHNFDQTFYREKFAAKVFDYAMGVSSHPKTGSAIAPLSGSCFCSSKKEHPALRRLYHLCPF